MFQPVQRESTRQKVYNAIREAILSGRLKTGQRLTEIPLSKEFRVSRAVVREALQLLAHDGLVDQNAYRGCRVVHLSPQQVDEIIAARMLVEPETVRLAIRHASPADSRHLRDLCQRLNESLDDPNLFAELDLEFHERLWELSGNETLRKILLQITTPLFAMGSIMRNSWPYTAGRKPQFRLGGHSTIVEKICAGDEEGAAGAMRNHIGENWKITRRRLQEYLDQGTSQRNSSASTERSKKRPTPSRRSAKPKSGRRRLK